MACLLVVAPEEWEYLRNLVKYYLDLGPNLQALAGHSLKREFVDDLFWINLMWGVVNLLPVWPLDGGQISRDVLTIVSPSNGASVAFGISLVQAGLLAVNALVVDRGGKLLPGWVPAGGLWMVFLFGYLAVVSYVALREEQSRGKWVDDHITRWDDER